MGWKNITGKLAWYISTIIYVCWVGFSLRSVPKDELTFLVVISCIFFFFYLLPFTLFGADIKVLQDGLEVQQYGRSTLAFSEINGCHSLLLVPFRVVLVTTKRKFPLSVLISGDNSGGKQSLREGDLSKAIKSALRAGAMRG